MNQASMVYVLHNLIFHFWILINIYGCFVVIFFLGTTILFKVVVSICTTKLSHIFSSEKVSFVTSVVLAHCSWLNLIMFKICPQNVIMENLLAYCSFWTIFGAVCVTKWYTPPEALCVGSSAYLYVYVPT